MFDLHWHFGVCAAAGFHQEVSLKPFCNFSGSDLQNGLAER